MRCRHGTLRSPGAKPQARTRARHARLSLAGGGSLVERLEELNATNKLYRYSILSGPLPVADYVAEIHVKDNGDGTSTIEWSSEFNPKGAPESEAVKTIRGIYQAGFDNLKKMFGG
jgi:Polyketide cyclase / dehydrase and lipid transport